MSFKPTSEYPDLIASLVSTGISKRRTFHKQEWQTIAKEIAAKVGTNGLLLDQETDLQGNCGLDAVLRGLNRLPESDHSEPTTAVLQILSRYGRGAAMQHMREQAVTWLEANKDYELVEGMPLEGFVTCDVVAGFSYKSFGDYLRQMRTLQEWIDQTVLYGLSAVYGVSILVFSGANFPDIVAINDAGIQPMIHIACGHQYHYWALMHDTEEEIEEFSTTGNDGQVSRSSATVAIQKKSANRSVMLEDDRGELLVEMESQGNEKLNC